MTRIAIDIDGTISNQCQKFRDIAERYGIKDHSYLEEYNGIFKHYTEDDQQLASLIFEDHLEEFILDQKPHDGALETWKKILDNPNIKGYFVTSRREETKDMTLEWLKKHGFTGAEDVLFLQDKTKARCSVLVDDHIKHIKSYIDKARMGYLVNRPYNKDAKVLRKIDSLTDFYNDILKYL